jgi:hypothetical protein
VTKGTLPKAYLRIDPNIDQTHPDNLEGFMRLLCVANRQPIRGVFRSREHLIATLGKAGFNRLSARGDVRQQGDGTWLVPGWEEWQEGDHTVAERKRRIRSRRADGMAPTSGAERTALWRLRTAVFERDRYTCRYCGVTDYPREWLVAEHVIPDGPADMDNLVAACRPCNKKKGGQTPEEAGMTLRDVSPVTVTVTPSDQSHRSTTPVALSSKALGQQGSEAFASAHSARDLRREGLPHITPAIQEAGEAITGRPILTAGDSQLTELDRLVEDHGAEAVAATFRSVANGGQKTWRQLVWDSMKALEPFSRPMSPKDREEAELAAAHRAWDAKHGRAQS